ncbi:MAG: Jag N-terminal domain-containing protein [Chloroflexi bacterium]|nr:Jag N-terminal domain-containing protein [Chloroflexota bacterium]
MTFREFTGKNVEEAIRAAMAEFSSDLSELDIEILAQGSRGVLGVGAEEARILAAPKSAVAAAESVRVESTPAAQEESPAQASPEPAAEPARSAQPDPTAEDVAAPVDLAVAAAAADEQVAELERADAARRTRGSRGRGGRGRNGRDRDGEHAIREPRPDRVPRPERTGREPAPFVSGKPVEELSDEERSTLDTAKTVLTEMLDLMGLTGTVEIASGGDAARLNVRGDDLGALIGRRGEKLASLQHIVNLIVGRREGQHHRIAIDVENYRGRREQQLRDVADRAAKRVVQTGKIIQLEAMPAVERRVVHMALLENPRIRTQSVGVEPNRRIVVLPAGQVKE